MLAYIKNLFTLRSKDYQSFQDSAEILNKEQAKVRELWNEFKSIHRNPDTQAHTLDRHVTHLKEELNSLKRNSSDLLENIEKTTPILVKVATVFLALFGRKTAYKQLRTQALEQQSYAAQKEKELSLCLSSPISSPAPLSPLQKIDLHQKETLQLLYSLSKEELTKRMSESQKLIEQAMADFREGQESELSQLFDTQTEIGEKIKKLPSAPPAQDGIIGDACAFLQPQDVHIDKLPRMGGIPQGGNSCYLASTLQVLAHACPDLLKPELSLEFLNYTKGGTSERKEKGLRASQEFKQTFSPYIEQLRKGSNITNINTLRSFMFRKKMVPSEYGQEDAMGVFRKAWDALQAPRFELQEEYTFTYRGEQSPQVTWTRSAKEGTLELAVVTPFPGEAPYNSLETALKQHLQAAQIDDFKHEGRPGLLTKKPFFKKESLPKTLPISLKRFEFGPHGSKKIDSDITVGDILRIPSEEGSVRYRLKGFVKHIGADPKHGHYVSYFEENGTWYCADDATVYPIDKHTHNMAKNQGYFYIFERIDG